MNCRKSNERETSALQSLWNTVKTILLGNYNMNAVPGVLKPTLGPDDAPEGLTGLRKAVIRIVTVCCQKRYVLNPAKGKSSWDDVQEHPGASFHITSPSRETQKHFILPAKRCQPGKLT